MGTKTNAQKIHSKRRAKERYGLLLHRQARDEFSRLIANGNRSNKIIVAKPSLRLCIYLLKYQENWYKVVYDKLRHTLVTFLPMKEADNRLIEQVVVV